MTRTRGSAATAVAPRGPRATDTRVTPVFSEYTHPPNVVAIFISPALDHLYLVKMLSDY